MGLLSFLGALSGDGGTKEDRLMRDELQRVREMAAHADDTDDSQAGGADALGPRLRRRYHFVGSVQGVGFRFTTTNLARSVGATGWVRNEYDGSVTAEVQGIQEQIEAVLAGLDRAYNQRGWLGGFRIDDVEELVYIPGELDFRALYE
jgi:acylphosphatase